MDCEAGTAVYTLPCANEVTEEAHCGAQGACPVLCGDLKREGTPNQRTHIYPERIHSAAPQKQTPLWGNWTPTRHFFKETRLHQKLSRTGTGHIRWLRKQGRRRALGGRSLLPPPPARSAPEDRPPAGPGDALVSQETLLCLGPQSPPPPSSLRN